MKLTALEMGDRESNQASIHVVGCLETDCFCIILGKVWKMRSPSNRPKPSIVNQPQQRSHENISHTV